MDSEKNHQTLSNADQSLNIQLTRSFNSVYIFSMSVNKWAHFFKPEVLKQGTSYFEAGDVFLKIAGDTQIQAYVKGSSPIKVFFNSSSIASPSFEVDCNCSSSNKGQLCKHIWATLLEVERKHPDFLDSKKELHKIHKESEENDKKEQLKAKQSDYRKVQYQKQKLKAQKQKFAKRGLKAAGPVYPEPVQKALTYFSENGFNFTTPIDPEELANARKILARVFHPDKGGTHEEVLLLNQNFELLLEEAT